MSEFVVAATRGTLTESIHHVSAIVVDPAGRTLAEAGDPGLVTYWRSAAKPFQLMPLVRDGGIERFHVDAPMLALACGSHNAELVHREVCARWLHAVGATEADLACGGHPSLWPALAQAMVRDDISVTPIWSNCSGKHSAMLALARLHEWSFAGYQERTHPVQQRVASVIAEWTGATPNDLQWGVDGCTAAAVALSVRAMAVAYARLGTSNDPSARVIRDAMMAEPYMVAGADRLDTALMQAWPGQIVVKIGAEGVYSASLPTLGIGLSLKIHDGDMASANLALVSLLHAVTTRLGSGQQWPCEMLADWERPPIRNTGGVIVGHHEVRGSVRWA